VLEKVNLTNQLDRSDYRRVLRPLQSRLHRLQRAYWDEGLSAIIVFEGWDAAGKGSSIRKLTERLEPRGFQLHRVREPRTFERPMPWLWRHWVRVPAYGSIGIFDRSWYGRVLVQRVEGTDGGAEWERTFQEINSFERLLADDRYIFIKFFLHIDKKEQRRRFKLLEQGEQTAWQIEPEDWKHHEQYEDYRLATEAMLEATETEWAPWTIIGATDRFWTRVQVLETVEARLAGGLIAMGKELPSPDDAWEMGEESWDADDDELDEED